MPGTVIQRKDHERHSDGTISIVPPTVVQTGGLPPACAMDIPIRHSEGTPHPAMAADADLDQGLACLGRPDHHHRREGLCNGHPASPAVYIRAASSPSREAHGGEASTDLNLDLGVISKTPVDFHFGPATTAFTAGDKSGVVSSPTSPLRTLLPSETSTVATRRRTIADRTAQKQAQADKMLFSDLYKSPKSPLSKLRNSLPHPVPVVSSPDYDADLLSRDKAKNKEAVRRFLAEKIRNDWNFTWPLPTVTAEGITTSPADDSKAKADDVVENPATDTAAPASSKMPFSFNTVPNAGAKGGASNPTETDGEAIAKDSGDEADSESDAESIYSIVSEDAVHFRPRAEWTSDLSDVETMQGATTSPKPILSPFRFDSPDSVGAAVLSKVQTKRAKRRRALRDEVAWNDGLACFVARRDAWTGAKTVRVRPKASVTSPTSPTSARRLSFWRTTSHTRRESSSSQPGTTPHLPLTATISAPAAPAGNPLSPTTTHASNTSSESESPSSYPIETLLPLAPPLIPAANTMRSSIVPGMYANIYDKVVAHSMQPSCPINLGDMIRSCVVGWKRDGEWPPRAAPPPEVVAVRRQKSDATQRSGRNEHGRKMSFVAGFGLLRGRSSEEKEKRGLEIGGKEVEEGGGNGGKGIRRSLQKVFLGLGGHHEGEHGHVVAA